MSERFDRMAALVRRAHAGQTRNAGRIPYSVHCAGVADICRDALTVSAELPADIADDLVLAAYGHDLYEDTAVTADEIRAEFGGRVADWIAGMTNQRGDADRAEYLSHMAAAEDEVRVIKCADLVDNMLSVTYGLHDLGLPWVRDFFLPIAGEMVDVVVRTPFTRLPRTGALLTAQVSWAWRRMVGGVVSADGHSWAEKAMTDTEDWAEGLTDEEYAAELKRRRSFSAEQLAAVREKMRAEDEERRRRLFGDGEVFAIPETPVDS